jgi:hypothetical protein
MSHKLRWVGAACCALALSVGAAKADTITTFDVSAFFVLSGRSLVPANRQYLPTGSDYDPI